VKRLSVEAEIQIVFWICVLALLGIGFGAGHSVAKNKFTGCQDARQVIAMRGNPDQFFVYKCGDGEYRTYNEPLEGVQGIEVPE
jgi:hypothetical protein